MAGVRRTRDEETMGEEAEAILAALLLRAPAVEKPTPVIMGELRALDVVLPRNLGVETLVAVVVGARVLVAWRVRAQGEVMLKDVAEVPVEAGSHSGNSCRFLRVVTMPNQVSKVLTGILCTNLSNNQIKVL